MARDMLKRAAERRLGDAESRYMNSDDPMGGAHLSDDQGAPEIRESVSYGEDQGGLKDWFKGKFGKKKPKTPEQLNDDRLTEFAKSMSEDEIQNLAISDVQGPVKMGISKAAGGGTATYFGDQVGLTKDAYDYRDYKSLELGMRVQKATPEELRSSPELQQMIVDDFNTNFGAALEEKRGSEYGNGPETLFRGKNGALKSFNTLLTALTPTDLGSSIMGKYTPEQRQGMVDYDKASKLHTTATRKKSDRDKMLAAGKSWDEIEKDYAYKPEEMESLIQGKPDTPDSLISVMDALGNGIEGSAAGDLMLKAKGAFLDHGFSEDDYDSMMMQNYLLRGGFNAQLATGRMVGESQAVQRAMVDPTVKQKSSFYGSLKRLLHR